MSNLNYAALNQSQDKIDPVISKLIKSQPQYNGYNLTNRVLFSEETDSQINKRRIKYYVPAYMRIKVDNFTNMEHQNLQASLNMILLFTLNLKNIPSALQELIKERVILRFNKNQAEVLEDDSENKAAYGDQSQLQEGLIQFSLRSIMLAEIQSDFSALFLTPFEQLNLVLSVNVKPIQITHDMILKRLTKLKKQMEKQESSLRKQQIKRDYQQLRQYYHIQTYVNLMDINSLNDNQKQKEIENQTYSFHKIQYNDQSTFGYYDLAEKIINVKYTNKNAGAAQVEQKYADYSKIQPFSYARFQLPVYRLPFVAVLTIFFPLWLLGVINFGIFFQQFGMGDRVASLASLMIAYVALIPVIRAQLPPNPNITLVQFFVYLQALMTILCIVQSFMVRTWQDDVDFFDWRTNTLYIACICIGVFEVLVVVILVLVYNFYWKRMYNKIAADQQIIQFNHLKWFNKQCDKHFSRKIQNREIKILLNQQ